MMVGNRLRIQFVFSLRAHSQLGIRVGTVPGAPGPAGESERTRTGPAAASPGPGLTPPPAMRRCDSVMIRPNRNRSAGSYGLQVVTTRGPGADTPAGPGGSAEFASE
eukprot:750433-Hanusia_phi.AAC.5